MVQTALAVESLTITNPQDRSYPFNRELFEDPCVLYHGSWSAWAPSIEREGLRRGHLPFDWTDVATVYNARRAVGQGSYLPMFLGKDYPRTEPPRDVFFSADFWTARSYATDGGGEVVRTTVEEATQFEQLCDDRDVRERLIRHWRAGLAESPGHAATQAALSTLEDDERMAGFQQSVRKSVTRLQALTAGGYPTVYAIRVEADWFRPRTWEQHIEDWESRRRQVDMRCSARDIATDRLLARVAYPNGTDPDFNAAWCVTWEHVLDLKDKP